LTIGNIKKVVHHQPSLHAQILVGYLLVLKLSCFKDSTQSVAGYWLFHYCMLAILSPLASMTYGPGLPMRCADGYICEVFPILAVYIADHPEQCLVACCCKSYCLKYHVSPNKHGELTNALPHDQKRIYKVLEHKSADQTTKAYKDEGLQSIDSLFWRDLPYSDIFNSIMPDILHQLHKGIFKDHLVSWCIQADSANGATEINSRYCVMSNFFGLQLFKKGITHIQQWTGQEHKEIEKVFIGVLAGTVPADVVKAVQAAINFIYYAQLLLHTDATLAMMETALQELHTYKNMFICLGIHKHFNIPKIHSLSYYVSMIQLLEAANGYNTEASERPHIDYVKDAYQATNQKDYVKQMTTWLQ
jgi:hypothetical protein